MLLIYGRICFTYSTSFTSYIFLDIVNFDPSGMWAWLRVGNGCTYAIETEANILRFQPLIQ